MPMTFALKMSVEQANHVKACLQANMKQQEAWIVAKQTTDEERTEAQRQYALSEKLLREFQ